jgi:hypothetical protein
MDEITLQKIVLLTGTHFSCYLYLKLSRRFSVSFHFETQSWNCAKLDLNSLYNRKRALTWTMLAKLTYLRTPSRPITGTQFENTFINRVGFLYLSLTHILFVLWVCFQTLFQQWRSSHVNRIFSCNMANMKVPRLFYNHPYCNAGKYGQFYLDFHLCTTV